MTARGPGSLTGRNMRQDTLREWSEKAFGAAEANSPQQRALRLLEETLEAFQAAGGSPETAHKLIDYVFSREVGDLPKEIGQVGVVLLLLLASAAGLSADFEEVREITRIQSLPPEHFAARNARKNNLGFHAMGELPYDDRGDDTFTQGITTLTREAAEKLAALLDDPSGPTPAMKKLFDESEDGS